MFIQKKKKEFKQFEVDRYGKWRIDRNVASKFLETALKEAHNNALDMVEKYFNKQIEIHTQIINDHDVAPFDCHRGSIIEASRALDFIEQIKEILLNNLKK